MAVKQGKAATAAGKSYYDHRYQEPGHYRGPWRSSPYRGLWESIAAKVPRGSMILEVGCGPGQLGAALCELTAPHSYRGFDFSRQAVALAHANLRRFDCAVAQHGDCRKQLPFGSGWDVLVCTEVLEHLDDDHGVFRKARHAAPGALAIFTVPNADSTAHVRYFEHPSDVQARYEAHLEGIRVETHAHPSSSSRAKWFLGWGLLR